MASAAIPKDSLAARVATVERHLRLENQHDLEGVLGTFGSGAQYHDEAWREHYQGRDGVRAFYQQLMKALPGVNVQPSWAGAVSPLPMLRAQYRR